MFRVYLNQVLIFEFIGVFSLIADQWYGENPFPATGAKRHGVEHPRTRVQFLCLSQ